MNKYLCLNCILISIQEIHDIKTWGSGCKTTHIFSPCTRQKQVVGFILPASSPVPELVKERLQSKSLSPVTVLSCSSSWPPWLANLNQSIPVFCDVALHHLVIGSWQACGAISRGNTCIGRGHTQSFLYPHHPYLLYHTIPSMHLLLDCLLLKMKALWSFKVLGTAYPATQHNIPEDSNLQYHHSLPILFFTSLTSNTSHLTSLRFISLPKITMFKVYCILHAENRWIHTTVSWCHETPKQTPA